MTDSELNEAVAKKLGYRKLWDGSSTPENQAGWGSPDYKSPIPGPAVGTWMLDPPDFCNSLSAAWKIIDHLQSKGHFVDLMVTPALTRCVIREASMGMVRSIQDGSPKAMARTICVAFLKME